MRERWFSQNPIDIARRFCSDLQSGLTTRQAQRRLKEKGLNKLAEEERESLYSIFMRQFDDFMVIVLMITTAVSAILGEIIDAAVILAIIVMNALLGFIQEFRAEKSLEALKQLTAPTTCVIRDNRQIHINTEQIVPGDILVLKAGDKVCADARLISVNSLFVDEAILTGESVPIEKHPELIVTENPSLGDQNNMVFMGTLITRGRGSAVVVATGMDTEIGKIAHMIKDTEISETPLQRRLQVLGKWLVISCLAIVVLVFITGVLQGFPVYKMFFIGVSLAVAAIPEGLPAVVTVALAIGVQRMIRCNAIIRKLPAVETLGCATVICSDKTGTLTQNKMDVQKYWIYDREIKIGDAAELQEKVNSESILKQAVIIGTVCNNAQVEMGGSISQITGDPTEAALIAVAMKAGIDKNSLLKEYKIIKEVPFDSGRKRMSVLVSHQDKLYSFVKGAPGIILDRCTKMLTSDGIQPLSAVKKRQITLTIEHFGEQALRILALAYRPISVITASDQVLERDLIFVGFMGMIDPPRVEAKRAISQARSAGIRTIMVTGDHKLTAKAIANWLRIGGNQNAEVMSGADWEKLSLDEQQKAVDNIHVFARVTPEHKLSIVRALQKNGEVVGMTGDGVNDAPAVKEADIGISMGITGTDVTKEASAMILADDNFQSIILAIKEGRAIYDNIRKFIRYLLACNVGEVLTMFIAALAGLPLPLIPIQILWMNLITDGLPAIALGVDPGDEDIMERPPRNPREGIFARRLHIKIGFTGFLISICTLSVFVFALWLNPYNLVKARTLAFTTLVMAQLIFVFQCRSEYHSIFDIGIFTNKYLVAAVMISGVMHMFVIYHPWFQLIFQTISLSFDDWMLILCFSAASLVFDTVIRIVNRRVKQRFSVLKVR